MEDCVVTNFDVWVDDRTRVNASAIANVSPSMNHRVRANGDVFTDVSARFNDGGGVNDRWAAVRFLNACDRPSNVESGIFNTDPGNVSFGGFCL